MKMLLRKYNTPTLADLFQMRAIGLRYYRQCLARFSQGELFYPFGLNLTRSSFEQTVEAVLWTLSSLDKEVDSNHPNTICALFYDLHFRVVPMHNTRWSSGQYFIHNYFEMRKTFHIYEVEDIRVFYRDKRKMRAISLADVDEPIEFDSIFYATTYQPYDLASFDEPRLHPHYSNRDWRMVLSRVLKKRYQFELNSPQQQSGVVLPFTRKQLHD